MDRKISELVKASEINNEDVLPVVQNGMTKKIPWENIKELKIGSAQPTKNEQVWFRKGKNELDTTNLIAQTFNGVSISRNSDGTITLNGTITASGGITILSAIDKLVKGTNTFSARIVSGTLTGGAIRLSINDNTETSATSTTARIFSTILNESTSINSNTVENLDKTMFYLSLYINSGITFTNCKIGLQVESGSTYTNYQSYINEAIYLKNSSNIFENYIDIEKIKYPYQLNLSRLIPANTNLNSLTSPGTYYSENAAKSATLSNSPITDRAFKLVVEQTSGRNRFKQTIYGNDTKSTTYVRTYSPEGLGNWQQVGVISTKTGTATTNSGGSFSSGISRDYDIISVVVMKTAGGNWTKADVYVRNDQANQVIYVRDVSNNAVANTEVKYRIKYIEN